MTGDLISREAAIALARNHVGHTIDINDIARIPAVDAVPITGDTSDGYHTFNELYHHRAVLFSVIVKAFPDKAWKARKHHDGSMFEGMFIVGIETPHGQATYHYDIDPYWEMFDCRGVEFAPEWDGHTAAQAIERIGKLEPVVHGRWIRYPDCGVTRCSVCDWNIEECFDSNFCPNCGARVDGEVGSDRGENHCIVDGTNVTITNEPFVIEGGFVVDVGKKADNALG